MTQIREANTATVVRVSNDQILTTDGPFVEAREHLGGFYIINAAAVRRGGRRAP